MHERNQDVSMSATEIVEAQSMPGEGECMCRMSVDHANNLNRHPRPSHPASAAEREISIRGLPRELKPFQGKKSNGSCTRLSS